MRGHLQDDSEWDSLSFMVLQATYSQDSKSLCAGFAEECSSPARISDLIGIQTSRSKIAQDSLEKPLSLPQQEPTLGQNVGVSQHQGPSYRPQEAWPLLSGLAKKDPQFRDTAFLGVESRMMAIDIFHA